MTAWKEKGCRQAVSEASPFAWDQWYAAVGGRTIAIDEVNEFLRLIRQEQEPRFGGPVASERTTFPSPEGAARHIKDKALEFGADIVGICTIEPTDVYSGRA